MNTSVRESWLPNPFKNQITVLIVCIVPISDDDIIGREEDVTPL